ncbi:MAG: hypothetical protein ACK52I_01645 [Pseudomonadota bacterium]|jgi:hypothetical protein
MTLELVVAAVSLVATLLAAGRVFFVTENDVKHLQRTVADLQGRVAAHDAIAVEGRGEHKTLVERVQHLSERVDEKASAESVENVAREVATLRNDLTKHLERIEKKIDDGVKR